ncbi:EpsG family protein [Pedobacter aquatilis]|uniref:EpsG family protein n=1 Tax=Pedobacter aquatilis TaxID=351343 RepID=UPI00292E9652|nr:EpsG family protein [Pedobacter aquatilis]
MAVYIFTFILFSVFSYLEVRVNLTESSKKALYFTAFFLIVAQVGLRWETGTDWVPYYKHFEAAISIDKVLLDVLLGFEIGYGYSVFLIRFLTDSYTVFLLLHALVYYLLVFKANKLLSPYPLISIFIFYTSTMGILGSNRQLIALSICLYSLKFVLDKKPLKFLFSIAIAFSFHTSALFFLIYYFLNRDYKKYLVVLFLLSAIVIGKSSIPTYVFSNFANFLGGAASVKAEAYSDNELSATSLSLTGLIRRLLFFALFLFNYDAIVKKWSAYKILFNGYLFGLGIYFLFKDTFIILVGRGSFYFNVMECFLLASQLLIFRYKKDKSYILIILIMYAILIFFQSISEFPNLFLPYKGIFINEDFRREGL